MTQKVKFQWRIKGQGRGRIVDGKLTLKILERIIKKP